MPEPILKPTRILVIGGGFGGIRAALSLAKRNIPNVEITLVSDKHHFEYTPALYKLATGRSPLETCIPLTEIFENKKVTVLIDTVVGGSLAEKYIVGASGARYQYDFLVLALGSENSYFNIPGIEEHSFAIKTVESALKLKEHIHTLFDTHTGLTKEQLMPHFNFVIVGGGPAGVELSGEIRRYVVGLAARHEVPQSLITVTIIQAGARLLPTMPEAVSVRAAKQLNALGINIIVGRSVTAEDTDGVRLKDISFNARTIIWTAGVKPNHAYAKITGLELDPRGRIVVDEHLHADKTSSVFAIGDSASTAFAGTAQTAIYDGTYVSQAIEEIIMKKAPTNYAPRRTPYVVPVGHKWALLTYKKIVLSGRIFWYLRELIDFRFLLSILPFRKAITAWRDGEKLCENCPTCLKDSTKN